MYYTTLKYTLFPDSVFLFFLFFSASESFYLTCIHYCAVSSHTNGSSKISFSLFLFLKYRGFNLSELRSTLVKASPRAARSVSR